MKKTIYLISLLLFIILSIFILNCTVDRLYTKDEFMALGEESDSSDKNNINIELKEVQLVDPATEDNGLYTFSTVNIRKSNGEFMFDGIDFDYDQPLNAIYNSADSGALSSGYFRVVHDGINVITGLSLVPVAKDLTNSTSPPSDEIYIDPEKGKFVLPRPIYWSKCESWDNIINNPDTLKGKVIRTYGGTGPNKTVVMGRFGNGVEAYAPGYNYFINLSTAQNIDCSQYTFSCWMNMGNGKATLYQFGTDLLLIELRFEDLNNLNYIIRFNGTNIHSGIIPYTHTQWEHLYLIFDTDEINKKIILFMDGVKVIEFEPTVNLSGLKNTNTKIALSGTDLNNYFYAKIDNIKIWDSVISENSDWLYNSGNGREEALHIIFGQLNNYKPGNIQVGYFYK